MVWGSPVDMPAGHPKLTGCPRRDSDHLVQTDPFVRMGYGLPSQNMEFSGLFSGLAWGWLGNSGFVSSSGRWGRPGFPKRLALKNEEKTVGGLDLADPQMASACGG